MKANSRIYVAGLTSLGAALIRLLRKQGYCHVLGDDELLPDLANAESVDCFFAQHRPEYLFHVAGESGGIHFNQARPADLCRDNLAVNLHLVEAAHRYGVERMLYVASSCCYPRHAPQPLRVESLWSGPLEPTNQAYAAARLAGMELCTAYRRQYDCDFRVGIAANSFGPGDSFDPDRSHVIAALIARMHAAEQNGEPCVSIWGSGQPRREFLYIDDLASACVHIMRLTTHASSCLPWSPMAETADPCEIVNLAGGPTLSIAELAERIRAVVGYGGKLIFDRRKPDGMPHKSLDAGPLLSTGWRPRMDFDRGLVATYAWYLEQQHPAWNAELACA